MSDIDTPAPAAEVKAERKTKVEIIRDYWPADGSDRLRSGDIADLPKSEAATIIRAGIATVPSED